MPAPLPAARSAPADFPAASEAARGWLALLRDVQRWADLAQSPDPAARSGLKPSDCACVAYAKLYELAVSTEQHGPAVEAARSAGGGQSRPGAALRRPQAPLLRFRP